MRVGVGARRTARGVLEGVGRRAAEGGGLAWLRSLQAAHQSMMSDSQMCPDLAHLQTCLGKQPKIG